MTAVWPCPQCGAKKGDPHKPSCGRARNSRKTRRSKRVQPSGLPWGKAGKFPTCRHQKPPRVHKVRGSWEYLQCPTCSKSMGKRRKQ